MSSLSSFGRTERLWTAGAGVVALLIVVVGWFFLISPQRDEATSVEGQTADAQTQNLTLQARISQLGAESKNAPAYAAALARAEEALPTQSNMSLFLRDVQKIASATSTRVTSLGVGTPAPISPPGAVAGAGATTTASGSATTPGGTSGGSSDIVAIPITASVTGSTAQLSNFLNRLQNSQPRAVLLSAVTRNVAPGTGSVLQLSMNAFYVPAAPSSPAASTTPSPGG